MTARSHPTEQIINYDGGFTIIPDVLLLEAHKFKVRKMKRRETGSDDFAWDDQDGQPQYKTLSPKAILIWEHLRARAKFKTGAYPGIDHLAYTFDCSRATARAAMRELWCAGLINVEARYTADRLTGEEGNGNTSHLYHLLNPEQAVQIQRWTDPTLQPWHTLTKEHRWNRGGESEQVCSEASAAGCDPCPHCGETLPAQIGNRAWAFCPMCGGKLTAPPPATPPAPTPEPDPELDDATEDDAPPPAGLTLPPLGGAGPRGGHMASLSSLLQHPEAAPLGFADDLHTRLVATAYEIPDGSPKCFVSKEEGKPNTHVWLVKQWLEARYGVAALPSITAESWLDMLRDCQRGLWSLGKKFADTYPTLTGKDTHAGLALALDYLAARTPKLLDAITSGGGRPPLLLLTNLVLKLQGRDLPPAPDE